MCVCVCVCVYACLGGSHLDSLALLEPGVQAAPIPVPARTTVCAMSETEPASVQEVLEELTAVFPARHTRELLNDVYEFLTVSPMSFPLITGIWHPFTSVILANFIELFYFGHTLNMCQLGSCLRDFNTAK